MGNGSGVSRGDRDRNARLRRLRALVPVTNAIVGIDLAGRKQMVVVTGHDSKVIARGGVPVPCLGSWLGAGLGGRRRRGGGLGGGDGVVRACRAPVAGAGAAGRGPAGAVGVRAAAGHVVGAAHRGPDPR
jgi:transposase